MKFLPGLAVLFVALSTTEATGIESGSVPLTRISSGEIGGWIDLPIEANGNTGHWLLDTGSSRNLVSAGFAKRHGLKNRSRAMVDTVLGPLEGVEVLLPTLRVGSLERLGQTALVVDLRLVVGAVAEELDGILGVPFFDGFEFELDLRNWTLNIRKGTDALCPAGTSALTLGQHRGLPVMDVVVDGGSTESFLLDTGNPSALVRIAASAPPASSALGIELPGPAWLTLARRVSIGEQQRLNVPVVHLYSPGLKRALGKRISGLAGTVLLDGARLRVDLARRRACVEIATSIVPGGFGMTLVQREGGLYAETVLPGGPAEAAGVRAGDSIRLWVGGAPVGTLYELWSRVHGLEEIELIVGDEARLVRLRRAHFAPRLP